MPDTSNDRYHVLVHEPPARSRSSRRSWPGSQRHGRLLPTRQAKKPKATTVLVVDCEEYRDVIADSLDGFVEKESCGVIVVMAALSSDEPVTRERAEKFIGRVRALKASVYEYEELLETRATDARANLGVAAKKARVLLALVADA